MPSARNSVQPYKVGKTNATGKFKVNLTFEGHYKEPNVVLNIPIDLLTNMQSMIFVMKYFVKEGSWESVMIHDAKDVEQGPADYTCVESVEEKKEATTSNRSVSPKSSTMSTSTASTNKQ